MKTNGDSPDRSASMSDWLYMTLRRLGRNDEATQVLERVGPNLPVRAYYVYWNRLRMYKGEITPEALLSAGGSESTARPTDTRSRTGTSRTAQPPRPVRSFEKVTAGEQWAAFGFAAAEAELARGKGVAH